MKFWQVLKEKIGNAFRTRIDDIGRNYDERRCLHSFAPQRERALSDLCGIAVLEEEIAHERGRTSDRGSSDSILKESAILISAAKRAGLYLDNYQSPGVRISLRSGESAVYWNAIDRMYYKIKNPFAKLHLKKHSVEDVIYEHIIHNILFPQVALEFLGVTEELREARLVFRQRGIKADRRPTDEQIAKSLMNIGLYPEARYCYGNANLFITDVLASSDNVLLGDDEHCYFIDPIIGFKKRAKNVIAELVDI